MLPPEQACSLLLLAFRLPREVLAEEGLVLARIFRADSRSQTK